MFISALEEQTQKLASEWVKEEEQNISYSYSDPVGFQKPQIWFFLILGTAEKEEKPALVQSIYKTKKLTEFLRSRYLVLRVTGIPDKNAIMSLLACQKKREEFILNCEFYAFLYFLCKECYLAQDIGSFRPLCLTEKHKSGNNITRHNVQVSEELRKKTGNFRICILVAKTTDNSMHWSKTLVVGQS